MGKTTKKQKRSLVEYRVSFYVWAKDATAAATKASKLLRNGDVPDEVLEVRFIKGVYSNLR